MTYTVDNFHPDVTSTRLHVGLLPDGTRRWARAHDLSLPEACLRTGRTMGEFLRCLFQNGCASVSVYVLSAENLRRSAEELAAVYQSLQLFCQEVLPPLADEFRTAVKHAGEAELLPMPTRRALAEIQDRTRLAEYGASGPQTRLYLCVAYNPLREIMDAMRCGAGADFVKHLAVPEPLDLVIRTGGAGLLSNFLPLQAGYARLYTTDTLFNDVTNQDLEAMLGQFRAVHRRIGE